MPGIHLGVPGLSPSGAADLPMLLPAAPVGPEADARVGVLRTGAANHQPMSKAKGITRAESKQVVAYALGRHRFWACARCRHEIGSCACASPHTLVAEYRSWLVIVNTRQVRKLCVL